MEYYKLVAVTGLPGLYELVSSKKDGAIVRSLQDKSTKFASTRIHQFSHLESIEIYTTGENVNLVEVFQAMEKGTAVLPDAKDDKAVKAYFGEVFPVMDFDRVYNSDMKKIVKWFDILKKNEIELKLSEAEPEATTETAEAAAEPEAPKEEVVAEEKPKKAAAKKKAAEKTTEDGADGEAPKAAPKKPARPAGGAAAKKKAPAKKKAEE
ncbi:DUF5606 domain-containing protein [Niabella yanshanensis]|uniref:DUF5606 domain-containing protein n=1 Tax=Niabella yanshanensis TaxID=577386 RepID=A0ABZ0W2N1_9BACT|nr:DUF5606 domain-containing protein [Niabella yanshanensis]WQD36360.1 DUF5606 domain-containing protein [Niabella yanshanensis]